MNLFHFTLHLNKLTEQMRLKFVKILEKPASSQNLLVLKDKKKFTHLKASVSNYEHGCIYGIAFA